jgi:hypothetical protein
VKSKQREWIDIDVRNVDTLPPPFEPLEVEAMPGVLFQRCPQYVLCSGVRTGVQTMDLHFAHSYKKTVGFLAVRRWRIRS